MTYRMDSDFPIPYAWVDRILPLPAPQGSTLLQRFIASHGKKAVSQGPNLAENKVRITEWHTVDYLASWLRMEKLNVNVF